MCNIFFPEPHAASFRANRQIWAEVEHENRQLPAGRRPSP